jgi:hypothetical protein
MVLAQSGDFWHGAFRTASVRVWPNLGKFWGFRACPFPSGFLPLALHNEISQIDPKATFALAVPCANLQADQHEVRL